MAVLTKVQIESSVATVSHKMKKLPLSSAEGQWLPEVSVLLLGCRSGIFLL